jgi:hypothetical protein
MKKLLLLSLIAIAIQAQAQNVGIGTPNPLGKLTINTESTSWNFPSVLLTDDATDNNGGAILQFRNPADKRMYLQSHFGTLANGSDTYMTFSHDATYNMRIRGDGNVGIGNLNPNLAGLVVDKKVGNVQAMFGSNTSGVSIESNFPGIHFNSYFNGTRKTISTGYTAGAEMDPTTGTFSIYTSPTTTTIGSTASVFNRLSIDKDGNVGIGNSAASEKLDVTGNINVTGLVKLNGSAGNAGQVLTSNGASAPTWASAAYNNNTRTLVLMNENLILNLGGTIGTITNSSITSTLYNKNATDISVFSNYIRINKSGLYHFDLKGNIAISTQDPETDRNTYINFFLDAGYSQRIPLPLEYSLELSSINTGFTPNRKFWKTAINVSYDVYITAPANVSFKYQCPVYTYGFSSDSSLGVHLISE